MLSSPAALWIPNAWFLRGWQGCLLLLPLPHSQSLCSSIIYGAHARIGPEIHTRHTSTVFFWFFFFHGTQYIPELLTSWLLSVHMTSVTALLLTSDLARSNATALTPSLSRLQVCRGHEGVRGPAHCSEQLKQTWAKKSRMASVGSASSTSPATSSFATTTTGYARSTFLFFVFYYATWIVSKFSIQCFHAFAVTWHYCPIRKHNKMS